MSKPEHLVERSFSMMIASYYLSRCGEAVPDGRSMPPSALRAEKWNAAYDLFFDAMGDGRTPSQFRNSMKNARDTFDILFDNGRIGWIERDVQRPSIGKRFQRVHDEWSDRSDHELEDLVLGPLAGNPSDPHSEIPPSFARTEGGEKVFVSVRRERNSRLRKDAIALHGLDCMACGFNFGKFYGGNGEGFIEVHHVVPLSKAGETTTDPKTDLIVICANCHRIVHRRKGICLSLNELKRRIGC